MALDEVTALLNSAAKSLSAVRPNVSVAKDYAQFVSELQQLATAMSSEAAALRRNDLPTARASLQKQVTLAGTVSSLAASLQITACAT